MDFFAEMIRVKIFTRSALAIAFILLYRHFNADTARCDPSVATIARGAGMNVRVAHKAIRELRESGWWEVRICAGTVTKFGPTNVYVPLLDPLFRRTGVSHETGVPHRADLSPGVDDPLSCGTARTGKRKPVTILCAEAFETFWQIYPSRRPHSNPKEPARLKFEAAVKHGLEPAIIIRGAENYAAYVASYIADPRHIAQAKTWLNEERWADYQEAHEIPQLRAGMI